VRDEDTAASAKFWMVCKNIFFRQKKFTQDTAASAKFGMACKKIFFRKKKTHTGHGRVCQVWDGM
jgi:hypothetical protein